MGLGQIIAPELPYLRRYARIITGSQVLGDEAVREMLESLLEEPSIFERCCAIRVELYRVFHYLWQPQAMAALAPVSPTRMLDSRARQVLALTTVEKFSASEAATILDVPLDVIEEEQARARKMLARQISCPVMIIEDEAIIALDLRCLLTAMGHKVVGIARTHAQAVELARHDAPELVLADIGLADGSNGIEAVKEILDEIDVPVIFVTAYPERLLTGGRPEPTYLVAKPFETPVLVATIAQALIFHRENIGRHRGIAA